MTLVTINTVLFGADADVVSKMKAWFLSKRTLPTSSRAVKFIFAGALHE